jgi:hypothetical protein
VSQGTSVSKEDGYELNYEVKYLAEMGLFSLLPLFPDQLL